MDQTDLGAAGDPSDRMLVLEMIEQGRITAEEGLHLLQALNDTEQDDLDEAVLQPADFSQPAVLPLEGPTAPPEMASPDLASAEQLPRETYTPDLASAEPLPPPSPLASAEEPSPSPSAIPASPASPPDDAKKWRRWWMIPLWIGVGVAAFGGLFMALAYQSSGAGFWFVCASVPMILGIVIIVLAWLSRSAPWLHLRVRQAPGEKPERIAFSMPLPIRPAAWFLGVFGRWIPGLREQAWDEVIRAVGEKTSPENPLFIQVDEGEYGEKVEIYIG